MKTTAFKVANILLFVLGITILVTSADSRDFGLILIIFLFTLTPVLYFIMLVKSKKKNCE